MSLSVLPCGRCRSVAEFMAIQDNISMGNELTKQIKKAGGLNGMQPWISTQSQ